MNYEPYYPHLWYTLAVTCISWLAVTFYSRLRLRQHPAQRVWLYAQSIALPLVGEGVSYVMFVLRPAPDTVLGYHIIHFHAAFIRHVQINFDTYLSPLASTGLIVLVCALMVISLMRFGYGTLALRRSLDGAFPLAATSHAFLLARLQTIAASPSRAFTPILVIPSPAPLAFTLGIVRPRIYIADSLLETLGEDEALAVLCHEWAHVLRRDTLLNWMIRLLRDTVCFLPGSFMLWRALLTSQDEACDLLAVRLTRQPLALARALVKVTAAWNTCSVRSASLPVATPFSLLNVGPQRRVEQMLAWNDSQSTAVPRVISVYVLSILLFVVAVLPVLLGS